MSDLVTSVYRFRLEPETENLWYLVPLAKVGNHSVFNQLFKEETQVKQNGPLAELEGLTTLIFYQNPQNKGLILRPVIFNMVNDHIGYGRFDEDLKDAVVARVQGNTFEVVISEGNRNFTLQLYQLLKDGSLDDEVRRMWANL